MTKARWFLKDQIKEYIRQNTLHQVLNGETNITLDKMWIANYFNVHERQVRRAFSELRKEGVYYFSKGKDIYQYYNGPEYDDVVEDYALSIVKSIETQYFNDLLSIKPLLDKIRRERKTNKSDRIMKKIGQIRFDEIDREENDE